jgi:CelD/BcsL family acetyltransferase involved in cellulose biosynthesis
MSVNIVRTLPEDAWRSFLAGNPAANVFHTPEMFRVFERTAGYRPGLWAAVDGEGRPLALLTPVAIAVLGGPLRRLTSRAVAYGSLLVAPGADGTAALAPLLAAYRRDARHRVLFTELRNLADTAPWRPALEAGGFAYEEHLNFLIDLARPPEAIWAGIRSNARRNIQKAQREGVVIEEATDPAQVPEAYAILRGVYRRLQVPLADQALFQAAFDILQPAGLFKIMLARVEGRAIGVMTLLLHAGTIIYWYTGVDKAYSACRANDLLVWHALEWGSRNGYHTFDFGGAGKPAEEYGVRDFKAKFGGELVSYGRYQCVHSPRLLRLSEAGYALFRRFL